MVGWLLLVEQLLNPIPSSNHVWKNLRRHSRWFIYFFVCDFSSFHPNNFRNTMSWKCIVKNDSVRSNLIELQSFLLSKFEIDPIHRPCFMHVPCKTRCFQVDFSGSLCSLSMGSTAVKNTVCLSFLKFCTHLPVSILNWWWNVTLIAHPTW